ncbi:SDR family NAD(P)-dependent oxidoreductase [Ectothiorhodospiraceae bacterium WFHF3C12]|nr:SDR family NAD(P)-dependent oxidoreductase [Ectothiorhodospiraceae bacterium WFHF3C12]
MSCVLITGAAGGLGRALAAEFHDRGQHLLLTDVAAGPLEEVAGALGGQVEALAGDITDTGHQRALLDRAEHRFGGVAVLVNNAGITHRSLAAKTDPAVLRKVMAVDWQAPLELALAALPQIQRHRGSIVNVGSMAGWMPVLGRAGYCAAKSALAQSFEVIRCEQQQHGVHVLMAYPSFLDTPIERNALGFDGRPARHARSKVGQARDAGWMAVRIVKALEARRRRVYSDRFSVFASVLWRLLPDVYLRLMRRKFAVELEQ